jgi:hypothetical protein
MPFESEAQRRFMYSQHPELAKEFEKATPKGADLPEHVKKMAAGGTSDDDRDDALAEALKEAQKSKPQPTPSIETQLTHPDLNNPDGSAKGIFITKRFADGGVTSGSPSELDPGIKDSTVSDFLLPYLLGPSTAKMGAEIPSALEGLGEAGEVTLGKAAPAMEETTNPEEVTAFVKGIQKGAPGEEGVKIWGVKGAPEKLKALFGDEAPGSVPENILREKGILPPQVSVPGQLAPNAYANGGVVDKIKAKKDDVQKADDIDPVISSTPTPTGYDKGGYPHVTFMEDQSPEENKKTTHLASSPKMAKGGAIHKAEDRNKELAKPKDTEMSHGKKLNSIYKAMGIKKYADGGEVGDVDPSQLPSAPSSSDPTYWDQIKAMLSKVGNSPAGTIAGMAMNPVSGIANAVEGAAPTILKAEAPAVAGVASAMTGNAIPAAQAAPTPPPAAPAAVPPATPPAAPAPSMGAGIPTNTASAGMPNIGGIFNQDTSKLTQGSNPEDRQALVDKLHNQQEGLGAIIAQAVSGLGDALAAKGGKEQHSLSNIFSMDKTQRDEALANFDQMRNDRLQKLSLQTQMGDNALKQAAAADAYGTDEHLNQMIGAPKGTMKKDLPTYFQMMSAQVAAQEKNADLYMKAHAQAGTDVDNAVKNSSVLGIKPSPAQLQASGAKLADQYYNRAKGNILVKPSDGGQAQWIPAQNLGKAKQMDPNLQVQQ